MEPGEAPQQAKGASGAQTPRKQASLTRLWSFSPKTPATETPSSHKKLRASPYETPESAECFFKDLEAKRLQAEEDEKDSSACPPPSSLSPRPPLRSAARRRELRARLRGPFHTTTTIPA